VSGFGNFGNFGNNENNRRLGLYLYVQGPYSKGMKTTRLQGIGIVDAKPAAELKAGDVTIWNYGYMHEVLAVEELSPKFVRLVTKSVTPDKGQDPNKVWHRRTAKTFLVGVVVKK
jgi:hypothetical protein